MNMKRLRVWVSLLGVVFILSACEKAPVDITSVSFVNDDKGSGNFNRMVKICFEEPLSSTYYHKITIVTKQSYKLTGGNFLRPMASDPDNKCQQRNLYSYINKSSPLGSREMIKDYMTPGNIHQVLVQIYANKPKGKELPMTEALFTNL